MKLKGRIAIVTGGGRGIGKAIALALFREGARLCIASRTESELQKVAEEVRDAGGEVLTVRTDVVRMADVAKLTKKTLDKYGQIDILVNAAGTQGPIGPVWEVDLKHWKRTIEVNLFGTLMCCQATLPQMIRKRRGKIVNFSGGGGTSPLPRFTSYGVSKTAVIRLTETIAEEVRTFNVQVNAVAPGAVDTSLQDEVLAAGNRAGDLYERIKLLRETGQGGVPPELAAELVVFLVSDDSDGLTGRLVSAPHDNWRQWDANRIAEIMSDPWFTLRRIDPFTLKPILEKSSVLDE